MERQVLIEPPERSEELTEFDSAGRRWVHNFQGDERQVFLQKLRATSAPSGGEESLGQVVELVHWAIHEVTLQDQGSGDEVSALRSVLISADGTATAYVSQGVAAGLRELHRQFGTATIDPPLAVTVNAKLTGSKRRVFVLEPA